MTARSRLGPGPRAGRGEAPKSRFTHLDQAAQTHATAAALEEDLAGMGIPIVAANLPFSSFRSASAADRNRSYPRDVLGVFGGGMALCIQAVTMACDAGEIDPTDRVVAMSADTAIVALASTTESTFDATSGLVVEHIICKPLRYQVSRRAQFLPPSPEATPSPAIAPLPRLPALPPKPPAPKPRKR